MHRCQRSKPSIAWHGHRLPVSTTTARSAQLVEPPSVRDGGRYFAWLYSPADARAGVAAVIQIERAIFDSVGSGFDHAVSHARLGWWQDELAQLGTGTPRHPATQALAKASTQLRLPALELALLVQQAEWELAQASLADSAARTRYFKNWGRAVTRTVALLGWGSERGNPRLPADSLALIDHFGSSAGEAMRELETLDTSPEHATSRESSGALRARLIEVAEALPPALAPSQRGMLVWLQLIVQDETPGPPTAWTAWRAARRAMRGIPHLRLRR